MRPFLDAALSVAPSLSSVCPSVRPSRAYDFLKLESRRNFKFCGNIAPDKSNQWSKFQVCRSKFKVTGNENVNRAHRRQKWIDFRQTKTKVISGPSYIYHRIHFTSGNVLFLADRTNNRYTICLSVLKTRSNVE